MTRGASLASPPNALSTMVGRPSYLLVALIPASDYRRFPSIYFLSRVRKVKSRELATVTTSGLWFRRKTRFSNAVAGGSSTTSGNQKRSDRCPCRQAILCFLPKEFNWSSLEYLHLRLVRAQKSWQPHRPTDVRNLIQARATLLSLFASRSR